MGKSSRPKSDEAVALDEAFSAGIEQLFCKYAKNQMIDCSTFLQMASDFDVVPTLLSKAEVSKLFGRQLQKKASTKSELSQSGFKAVLRRVSMAVFKQYPTSEQQNRALFEYMSLGQLEQLRHKLSDSVVETGEDDGSETAEGRRSSRPQSARRAMSKKSREKEPEREDPVILAQTVPATSAPTKSPWDLLPQVKKVWAAYEAKPGDGLEPERLEELLVDFDVIPGVLEQSALGPMLTTIHNSLGTEDNEPLTFQHFKFVLRKTAEKLKSEHKGASQQELLSRLFDRMAFADADLVAQRCGAKQPTRTTQPTATTAFTYEKPARSRTPSPPRAATPPTPDPPQMPASPPSPEPEPEPQLEFEAKAEASEGEGEVEVEREVEREREVVGDREPERERERAEERPFTVDPAVNSMDLRTTYTPPVSRTDRSRPVRPESASSSRPPSASASRPASANLRAMPRNQTELADLAAEMGADIAEDADHVGSPAMNRTTDTTGDDDDGEMVLELYTGPTHPPTTTSQPPQQRPTTSPTRSRLGRTPQRSSPGGQRSIDNRPKWGSSSQSSSPIRRVGGGGVRPMSAPIGRRDTPKRAARPRSAAASREKDTRPAWGHNPKHPFDLGKVERHTALSKVEEPPRLSTMARDKLAACVELGVIEAACPVTLVVEHCQHCEAHKMSLRHDPRKYVGGYEELVALARRVTSLNVKVVRSKKARLGSFEITLKWSHAGFPYQILLHSKLATRKFPNLTFILGILDVVQLAD